jgi:hypothetical protein
MPFWRPEKKKKAYGFPETVYEIFTGNFGFRALMDLAIASSSSEPLE